MRTILRKVPNARFVLAEVKRVDLGRRVLETDGLDVPYDYLILATGTVDHFFRVPGAAEHAYSLKSLEHDITLRNHILGCIEQADQEVDEATCHQLLSFAIVGGGPTGVETAGALAELVQGPVRKDFPRLDLTRAGITLIEAAERLLPTLPERLGFYAAKRLREMGVDVRLECPVESITPTEVHLQDGSVVLACTAVWAAGVRGDPQAEGSGLPTATRGRIAVEPTLQVPDHPEVYAIGDLAYFEQDGEMLIHSFCFLS